MKAEDWHKDTGEENTGSIINCRLYRTVKTQKDSKVNRSRDWTKEHKRKTRQRSNHQEMLSRPAFFFSQAGGRKGLYPCQWKTKADFAEGACMLAPSWSQECISEANVLIRLLLLLDANTLNNTGHSQGHRIIPTGKNTRRSLVQLPAHRRVSSEVRSCCAGLHPAMLKSQGWRLHIISDQPMPQPDCSHTEEFPINPCWISCFTYGHCQRFWSI